MKAILPCAVVLAAAIGWAAPESRQALEQSTLQGLAGVRVVVEVSGGEAQRRGLAKADLVAGVESQLRKAGVVLLAGDERAQGMPTLALNVVARNIDERPDGMYVYSIDLELSQDVRLVRNPGVKLSAPTWRSSGSVGTIDATSLPQLRKTISEHVDAFVAACRAADAK